MTRAVSKVMSRASDHIWRLRRRRDGVCIRNLLGPGYCMSNSMVAFLNICLKSGHSNACRYIAIRISAGSVRKGFSEL